MQEITAGDDSVGPGAVTGVRRWAYLVLGLILVAAVGGAYWIKSRPDSVSSADAASQEALMKAGLEALYTKNDPEAAAVQFRKLLTLNVSHYGATYQLATALDRAGKPSEARSYWEKMLPMAEAVQDQATLATVRARLQKTDVADEPAIQAALMSAGLDALYKRQEAAAAAVEFRKVLARNPSHYGATYQLATALDRLGKANEARPLWERVVKMAEGYNDQKTLATARARLARTP